MKSKRYRVFGSAVFLPFLGLLVATASIGETESAPSELIKTISCQKNAPAETQYTSVTVNLDKFSIPANWDDSGSEYEIRTRFHASVYPKKSAGVSLCDLSGNWGTREYPKLSGSSDERWSYPLDLKLIIQNVPVDGVLQVYFSMNESDEDQGWESLDLNRYTGHTGIDLRLYPMKKFGYLLPPDEAEIDDPAHLVEFGKSKRFLGDESAGKVIASLDLTIDTPEPLPVSRVVEQVVPPQ